MAITIIHEPKEITFADSPQYLTISDTNIDNYFLKLTVWRGLKSVVPVAESADARIFDLVQKGNSTGVSTVSFQIDEFLETLINFDDYIPSAALTAQFNDNNGVWYQMKITAGLEEDTYTTKFATMGKGLYTEGVNPGTTGVNEGLTVFGNQSTKLFYHSDKNYILPIYIGLTSINQGIDTNLGYKSLIDLGFAVGDLNTDDSTKQIAYITIGPDVFTGWVADKSFEYSIVNTSSGVFDHFNKIVCSRGRPKSLKYLSFSGTILDLPVNGSDYEDFSSKKTEYNNLTLDLTQVTPWDSTKHVKKTFIVNSMQVFNLFTGWIYENENQMIRELLSSKRVWLEIDTGTSIEIYPCTITSNKMRVIRRLFKNEIGYDLTVEGNPYLNKVV